MLSKKGYLLVILLVGTTTAVRSQHLSLFNVNSGAYPSVKADFHAFNAQGIQHTQLTQYDVSITENGVPQKVIKVTNPTYSKPKPLSVVLSIDISGSMSGRNMSIAKQAAGTLVQLIQLDQSECAITSFDDSNYINSDFSNDLTRLSKAINTLQAQGGTNYNEAFNNELTGALEIAKTGSNKKVIIFLTDGLGTTDQKKVIQKANDAGVIIYCVTIDMYTPKVLKEIATNTGGGFFEYVNSIEQAKKVYQKILFEIQELSPSTVEWESNPDCETLKLVTFQAPTLQLSDNSSYRITEKLSSKLIVSSNAVKLKKIVPGNVNDTTITLRAVNADITVLSAVSTNDAFELVNTGFPVQLAAAQSTSITLRHKSTARKYEEAKISINTNRCTPTIIYINNGLDKKVSVPLKVEHPNGGEVFFAGSDTVINWSGVFPSEEVKLELSTDSARNWKTITTNAKTLRNEWHVPNTVGDKMLIRTSLNVSSIKSDLEELYAREGNREGYYYTMSPDNSKLIYESRYKTYVLNLMTGALLDTIDYLKIDTRGMVQFPPYPLSFFNSDGSRLYTYRYGGPLQVYSTTDYKPIGELPPIEDDTYINDAATKYLRQRGNVIQIVDLVSGNVLNEITIPKEERIVIHADSFRDNLVVILKTWKQTCEVWDINTGLKVASFATDLRVLIDGIITVNKKYLVVKTANRGNYPHAGKFVVFDLEKKKELYSWTTPDENVALLDVSGDVMLRTIEGIHQIVVVATSEVIAEIPYSSRFGSLSPDGKFVMMYSRREQMKMFRFDPNSYGGGKGADVSDNTFSIIAPKIVAKAIDFKPVRIGDIKEQIYASFIRNVQNTTVKVDTMYLQGGDITAFSIVSNQRAFKIKGLKSSSIELRFKPMKIGVNQTSIIIQTPFEKILVPLKGEGIESKVALKDRVINLGKVTIGTIKDSLVTAVIKNISASTVLISSVKITGPDLNQFVLESNKGFKLKKNASKDLQIAFNSIVPGKTTTRIRYTIEGEIGIHELNVFAEGLEEKELVHPQTSVPNPPENLDSLRIFRARILDMVTQKPIPSTLVRSETKQQSNTGLFEFTTTFNSQIKMVAEADGYLPKVFILEADSERKSIKVTHNFLLTRVISGKIVQLDNVLFVQGKPILLPESNEQLDMLYRYLINHPEDNIELAGHTDNQGNVKLNQQLSEERVLAIKEYLINKGINKKRISGKGYGATKPRASNAKESTRRLNRRVEFKILK